MNVLAVLMLPCDVFVSLLARRHASPLVRDRHPR
jgi:hypothetical protein